MYPLTTFFNQTVQGVARCGGFQSAIYKHGHGVPVHTYMNSYIHTFIHTDISGHRVGRSVFSCSGTDSGDPVTYIVPGFHRIISLRTACGDSVFCCSGTARGDPCHYIHFIAAFLCAPPVATQLSVLSYIQRFV